LAERRAGHRGGDRRRVRSGLRERLRPRRVPWRPLVPLALLALLLALMVSTAGAAGLVFSDGFESGNLSQWTASSGMTVQQPVVYAGSWAARATSTGSPAYAY